VVDQETFVFSGVKRGGSPWAASPSGGEEGHHHYYHIWFPNNIELRISTELKIASFFAGYPEIESPEQQTGILQGPDKRIQKRNTAKTGNTMQG
jgi:hypothetical protein